MNKNNKRGSDGRWVKAPHRWLPLLENPQLKEFSEGLKEGSRRIVMADIDRFLEGVNITVDQFLSMERKAARDLDWSWASKFRDRPSRANAYMDALNWLYRFAQEETLGFDWREGGKHYVGRLP